MKLYALAITILFAYHLYQETSWVNNPIEVQHMLDTYERGYGQKALAVTRTSDYRIYSTEVKYLPHEFFYHILLDVKH